MRVGSIVGARSELVRCAPVLRALAGQGPLLLHTGAAFDYGTTPEFYADLGLPLPDHNLNLGRGTTAERVGAMQRALVPLLQAARLDWVLVYGSSAATLAGALAATKVGVPVGHVEAGVRSYRRDTPDELYPLIVDQLASLHFCPTPQAVLTLEEEGIGGLHNVGDVLLDNVVHFLGVGPPMVPEAELWAALGLEGPADIAFATVHHHENTHDRRRLSALIEALSALPIRVVVPLHPRSQEQLAAQPELVARIGPNVLIVDPLRPKVTLAAVARSKVVLTDSGGLQREAYYLGVPCITLRDGTEWVDTLDLSANTVAGADGAAIAAAVRLILGQPSTKVQVPVRGPFGQGDAAQRIVEILARA